MYCVYEIRKVVTQSAGMKNCDGGLCYDYFQDCNTKFNY
jgi:hypothetical protein